MKIMKFVGLLLFMVILDFQASAQNCNPAACTKAMTNVEKSDLSLKTAPVTLLCSTTAVMTKICDPTDCPPECRKICKIDCCKKEGAASVSASQIKHVLKTPVQRLEARSPLQVRSSVVGAD